MRLLLILMLCGCGYISDAQKTVFDQTKASAVLKKYEWFKDAAAQLESFDATIKVQQKRLAKKLRAKLSGGLPKEVVLYEFGEDPRYFKPEWMEITTSEDTLSISIIPTEKTHLEILNKIPRKSHLPPLVRDYEYWGEPTDANGYDNTLILLLLHGY